MSFIFSRTRIIEMVYLFFGFLSVVILYMGIFKFPNHERIVIEVSLALLVTTFLMAADLSKNFPLWIAVPSAFFLHCFTAMCVIDCIGLMPVNFISIVVFILCFAITTKMSRYAKKHDLKIF